MNRTLQEECHPSASGTSPFSERKLLALSMGLSPDIIFLDAITPQCLAVPILQDVPIALTGLSVCRRVTVILVVVDILSNLLAKIISAHAVSRTAIANRLLSVLSLSSGRLSRQMDPESGHPDRRAPFREKKGGPGEANPDSSGGSVP